MLCRYGSGLRLEVSLVGTVFVSLDVIKLIYGHADGACVVNED